MPKKRSILSVFAHPDDESYTVGGVLAKYHQQGVRLVMVTLTDGGSGSKRLQPGALPDAPLGECRLKELEMACQVLGVDRLITLGYVDGKLDQTDRGEMTEKIASIIREERPDIILTLHPNGVSGHSDHTVVAEVTTEAFLLAAKTANSSLPPHQVKKLYYYCMSEKMANFLKRRYPGKEYFGVKEEEITTVIDTSDYKDIRVKALSCHQTQFNANGYTPDALASRFNKEFYQRYYPAKRPGEFREVDIFEGL